MKRRLTATQSIYPFLRTIIEDFEVYCRLADAKPNSKAKRIWNVVDTSIPISVDGKIVYVRILTHKEKGRCLDIRVFVKKEYESTVSYEPTDEGIMFPVNLWKPILDAVFKLIKKHTNIKNSKKT